MEHEYQHDVLTDPKSQIRLLKVHISKPDATRTVDPTRRTVDDTGQISQEGTTKSVPPGPSSVIDDVVLIECTMETFGATQLPPYRALSYTWGPEDATRMISVNVEPFKMRENLWHFLHQIASGNHPYAGEWLWVDQICIDQDNDAEKGHQVGLMHRIFSDANEVLCWLGPAAEDSELAIQYLERLAQGRAEFEAQKIAKKMRSNELPRGHHTMVPNFQSTSEESGALLQFFARPYWSRVWIVQELYLAQALTFVCGAKSVCERVMICALECFNAQCQQDQALRALEFPTVPILSLNRGREASETLGNVWIYVLPRKGHFGSRINIQSACSNSLRLRCALPHDHIYGMLALATRPTGIEVDYKKAAADVFWEILPHIPCPRDNPSPLVELGRAMGVTGNEAICQPGNGSLPLAVFRTIFPGASPEEVFSEATCASAGTQS